MAELQDLGVADFLFDFQGRAYGRKELEILLKKFRTRRPLKDSVDVNYERGLR